MNWDFISQKTAFFTVTVMKTSNLTQVKSCTHSKLKYFVKQPSSLGSIFGTLLIILNENDILYLNASQNNNVY
jgi:hypothetical protein